MRRRGIDSPSCKRPKGNKKDEELQDTDEFEEIIEDEDKIPPGGKRALMPIEKL